MGIALLLIAKRHGHARAELLRAVEARFDLERREMLYAAAEALDAGDVRTASDAVHPAEAFHRGSSLHTADADLLSTASPTSGS